MRPVWTNLANKGFIIWLSGKFFLQDAQDVPSGQDSFCLARLSSQSRHRIWFILPAHEASHAYRNNHLFSDARTCKKLVILQTLQYVLTFVVKSHWLPMCHYWLPMCHIDYQCATLSYQYATLSYKCASMGYQCATLSYQSATLVTTVP